MSQNLIALSWRAGSVDLVLTALSELPLLTFLDFTSQNLYGTLPENVTFPKLEYLGLRHNQLQARPTGPPPPFPSALWSLATAAGHMPAQWSAVCARLGTVECLTVPHLRQCVEGDRGAVIATHLHPSAWVSWA